MHLSNFIQKNFLIVYNPDFLSLKALFLRLDVFQRCTALNQQTRNLSTLISAVSDLVNLDYLSNSAVRNIDLQKIFT